MLENRFDPKWIYGDNIKQIKLVALSVEKSLKVREKNGQKNLNTTGKYALYAL